jgi:hypothetical protein
MCHVADKFYAAVRALTADAPLKQRLISAYVDHLETLSKDDLPEALRPRFEALRAAMHAVPPTEKETAVQVSVRKMSLHDAGHFSRSILGMFTEQLRVKATGERVNAGEGPRTPVFHRVDLSVRVPAFLAR